VREEGSELAAALWDARGAAASSILAYPEGRAALAAAHRARRLTDHGYNRALAEFEAAHDELVVVGMDDALARHAGALAADRRLRGYDAVHLASALALGAGTVLIAWDKDLRRAAMGCGCAVAPAT
jgi:predicted nucleic acid-binding protein